MSINDNLSVRIIEAVVKNKIGGKAIMLGRQNWQPDSRDMTSKYVQECLDQYLPGTKTVDLASEDGYSEQFFKALGFDEIDSLDASNFENATVIANLGKPLPKKHHGKYDYVYDGGTVEHVFEFPTAMRNIDKLLKPGGFFQAHSPCNNFINHGFVQICPEMVFGFWAGHMGYEVIDVKLIAMRPVYIGKTYTMTNPMITKKRPRIDAELPQDSRIILDYVVRKPLEPRDTTKAVMQSDYLLRWSGELV